MSQPIPAHLQSSVGLNYVVAQGWNWQDASDGQIRIENCHLCKKDNYHLYMGVSGHKDGLWFCHFCGKSGNLRTIQESLGQRIPGVDSRSEWGAKERKADALPDTDKYHTALLGDADALDYLTTTRGFSMDIIKQQKLGLAESHFFRSAGNVRALVIPYLVNGNTTFAKYRTLPPSPKDFTSPTGYEAPLYNQEVLRDGISEITFVEGECDAISLLSNGITQVVGVPGANLKKAIWIEALDRIAPKHIYILYDNDKVGTKAAQELASRIGYDKCLKLVLPYFEIVVPIDECKKCSVEQVLDCDHKRPGKDVNEWFAKGGGTKEEFEKLKENAQLFDVTGVAKNSDVLDDLATNLEGKTSLKPTYQFGYEQSLDNLIGMEDGDVLDIIAPEKVGKTTFGLNLMERVVDRYDEDGLIICLEMTQIKLARKWVCMVTGTADDSIGLSPEVQTQKLEALKAAIPQARARAVNRKGDLYFACPKNIKSPDDIFKLIRDCIRRYGVKWVMFDNVQLLCDTTLHNYAHRTAHLSTISKNFARLAKEYGIKLIRIIQPKRLGENQLPTTDTVDGSSQIMKDCDAAITLYRTRVAEVTKAAFEACPYIEGKAAFKPEMFVNLELSRYYAGGQCTMYFDGATSQVLEYTEAMKRLAEANKPKVTEQNNQLPTEVLVGEMSLG